MFYSIHYTGSPWSHLKQIILSSDNSWRTPYEQVLTDQNGNLRQETVVNRGVTAIYHFDFFLQGKRSNFNSSSFFCRLISSSQHMAGFKGRRNLRITSSFMTRSDSRLMNSRTLRMPWVTCFLGQRRLWAWFHRHTMRILLVNVVGVTCTNFYKASLPVENLLSAATKKLSCVKHESPGITALVDPCWRIPCFTFNR